MPCAVATGEKEASATNTLIDCAKIVVYYNQSLTLYGAIVDNDLPYVQKDLDAALSVDVKSQRLNAWRGIQLSLRSS